MLAKQFLVLNNAKNVRIFRHLCTNPNPQPVENQKIVRVAIIGVPNVGKSTLINELVDHRVCPVSRKVHTTRNFSRAITVRGQTQVVFFDTPGLITQRELKKHNLESSFLTAYRHSIQNADLIGVTHDVSNTFTRDALHSSVIDALHEYQKLPSFLILNKIDAIRSKRVLLDLVRTLSQGCLNGKPFDMTKFSKKRGRATEVVEAPTTDTAAKGTWPNFQEVFMVSALTGDGIQRMIQWVAGRAKEGQWIFEADQYTDRKPEDLVVQSIQARLLDYLPQEIPYQLDSQLEFFEIEKGKMFVSVLVTCPSERIEKLVCGVGNGKLHQITESCTSDLIETFKMPISLTISTMARIKTKTD